MKKFYISIIFILFFASFTHPCSKDHIFETKVQNKLNNIFIDSIQFNNTPALKVFDALQDISRKKDPKKEEVNFVFLDGNSKPDNQNKIPQINLNLKKVPLKLFKKYFKERILLFLL